MSENTHLTELPKQDALPAAFGNSTEPSLALNLPEWDLLPPTEFLDRHRAQ
jgi:hypothetical protein